MSRGNKVACICVALGLGVLTLWTVFRPSGPVVRDTPFMRELNQIYRMTGQLIASEQPLPKGADSKHIEAFVAAGILSSNDGAYIRQHGIQFYGFDSSRTGADVLVFETVCSNTTPPRRITAYADGHADYHELGH